MATLWWDDFGSFGGGGGGGGGFGGGGGSIGFNFADPSSRYGGGCFDSFGGGGISAYSSFGGGGAQSFVNTPMLGGGSYRPHFNSAPATPTTAHSFASATKANPAQATNLAPVNVAPPPSQQKEAAWEVSMDNYIQKNHLPPLSSNLVDSQAYHDYYDILTTYGSYDGSRLTVPDASLRGRLQTLANSTNDYAIQADPVLFGQVKDRETYGMMKDYAKIAIAGGSMGAATLLLGTGISAGVVGNGFSGAVGGYMDGGGRGALVGGVVGMATGLAGGPAAKYLGTVGGQSWAAMSGRTLAYSGVGAAAGGAGTIISNLALDRPLLHDVGKGMAVGAVVPFMSGEAAAVGVGGERVFGAHAMDGLGVYSGALSTGATAIDPESRYGPNWKGRYGKPVEE